VLKGIPVQNISQLITRLDQVGPNELGVAWNLKNKIKETFFYATSSGLG